MDTKITETQTAVLHQAALREDGIVEWFPSGVKGHARTKVIDGLSRRNLVELHGDRYKITKEGYEAIGVEAPTVKKSSIVRPNSKKEKVIKMLQRLEGATVQQIINETGWLPHTVQGFFSGVLRKKLGFVVDSEKQASGDRVYKIFPLPY